MMLLILAILTGNVTAAQYDIPSAPPSVSDIVPKESEPFGQGLWQVVKACIQKINPALSEAGGVCLRLFAIVLLTGLVSGFSNKSSNGTIQLAAAVAAAVTLTEPSIALFRLGSDTVQSLSEYGKLLLPVMTAAMAAQGATSTSTGLYAATALFDSILSSIISRLLLPMLYLFLGICIANAALSEPILGKIRAFIQWLMTWSLKIALYLFTGFLTITGVVSGSADAAAIKAAKLTISGAVPVVGSILSDASETILVSAGMVKNTAGIYGLITLCTLFLEPFVQIGCHYILIKATGAVCEALSKNGATTLIQDFSSAMGLIVAMTATQTILLLVSTVCFMKGVSL